MKKLKDYYNIKLCINNNKKILDNIELLLIKWIMNKQIQRKKIIKLKRL